MCGQNIFSPYLRTSFNETIANRSVIILASRMDSFSFFNNLSPASDSVYSGVVTLLAVAHTLASYRSEIIELQKNLTTKRNILFSLFDAESFGYIGSSSALNDMIVKNEFPVMPSHESGQAQMRTHHFSHFIELSQLAPHEDSILWIHANMSLNKEVNNMIEILKERAIKFGLSISSLPNDSSAPIPPSSLQNFLKYDPKLIGIVLTNHKKQYTNTFFHSIYDNYNNLRNFGDIADHLTKVTQVVASVLYKLLTDEEKSDIKVETKLIERLVDCYLVNSSCTLFNETVKPIAKVPFEGLFPIYFYLIN
jgi:nicastrin